MFLNIRGKTPVLEAQVYSWQLSEFLTTTILAFFKFWKKSLL